MLRCAVAERSWRAMRATITGAPARTQRADRALGDTEDGASGARVDVAASVVAAESGTEDLREPV